MFGTIPIPPPPRLLCSRCLWPYGVALSPAPWLTACAASLPPFSFPCGFVGGCALLRRCGLGGFRRLLRRAWPSAKVAGKVAVIVASTCAKVAHLPQNHSRLQNSVYKGGIFVAHFPKVGGKSCKSRSVSAHFTSKSLASMYFCWSCSGVKPSICGWFGVKTISCLSTMP